MKYIDPDGRQGVLPMPGILPLPVPTSTKAPTASDYKNAGREIRNGIVTAGNFVAAAGVLTAVNTYWAYKDITNPGWRNQEKQDRKTKEKLDQAQANVAVAIENNIPDGSGDGKGGDPKGGKIGAGALIIGGGTRIIMELTNPDPTKDASDAHQEKPEQKLPEQKKPEPSIIDKVIDWFK